MSRVKRSADVVHIVDTQVYLYQRSTVWADQAKPTDYALNQSTQAFNRHRGSGIILFADGHVGVVKDLAGEVTAGRMYVNLP